MSVEAKHAYRFIFLKSEEWKALRLAALVRDNAQCCICDKRDLSNDVHHIKYPKNWYDTHIGILKTLCRECHDKVHDVMEDNPDLSWKKIRFVAFPDGHPKKVKGSEYARRHFAKQKELLTASANRV